MCRQGGYYEQAAYLAKQHGEADLVVDILIEDSKLYAEALIFIWQQDPDVVCVVQLSGLAAANVVPRHSLVSRSMPAF